MVQQKSYSSEVIQRVDFRYHLAVYGTATTNTLSPIKSQRSFKTLYPLKI